MNCEDHRQKYRRYQDREVRIALVVAGVVLAVFAAISVARLVLVLAGKGS